MKLRLVDGIGPFFRFCRTKRINWSKIPFESLEKENGLDPGKFESVRDEFQTLILRCSKMGFNAVTLDDLAHLWQSPGYPDDLNSLISAYRQAYSELFETAEKHGMDVYITTDVMFYSQGSKEKSFNSAVNTLRTAVEDLLASFPEIAGVIVRLGECDGMDVEGRFQSRLTIKSPRQAKSMIEQLLPVFEKYGRNLIVRTWTVGAYRIGDLIWNRNTFDKVFKGIDSPNLIISLKYGETDFFRYLPLNKLFFRSSHNKIIELQARREYEGAGQFPSFIGWDYERLLRQLNGAENVVGAWVWIQSGGWTTFRRITLLDESAIWNDLNAYVCARLVCDNNCSTEEAVEAFSRERLKVQHLQKLLLFLRLSDEVIRDLLYLDQLARRKLFFRRLRVPPLLAVFWDQIIVNHSMRKLLRCLVTDPDSAILQGHVALQKLKSMQLLAEELELPSADIQFQYDSFQILQLARYYYFGPFNPALASKLQRLSREYKRNYSTRYSIRLDFSPFPLKRKRIRLMLALWMRKKRGYRIIDRILMIGVLSWLSPIFLLTRHKSNADLLNNRAMGIRSVFK